MKHGRQKYRSDDQIIISQVRTRTSSTTVAGSFAMIRLSRGSRKQSPRQCYFSWSRLGRRSRKPMRGTELPAAGNACGRQLEPSGEHGIDWIRNHQHPQIGIEAAFGQADHVASTARHHSETQHHRPAGARTGLAASRWPALVVQEICRVAGAVADDDLAGTQVEQVADVGAATCRHRTDVTLPHIAALMQATDRHRK